MTELSARVPLKNELTISNNLIYIGIDFLLGFFPVLGVNRKYISTSYVIYDGQLANKIEKSVIKT